MKVYFDQVNDKLVISLRSVPAHDSFAVQPGIICNADIVGNIVSIEVLDASHRVDDPGVMRFGVHKGVDAGKTKIVTIPPVSEATPPSAHLSG